MSLFVIMSHIDQLPKLLYSVRETAFMMGVAEKTVYRLLKRGLLKAPDSLRHKKITADSLRAFIK